MLESITKNHATMLYLWIHGLPKRAEYDMFESIRKNHALKLNEDICIFMVMEPRADVPWLLSPQMTTSVDSRSSTIYLAHVILWTGKIFTAEPGLISICH
jgi:hypothetical protein